MYHHRQRLNLCQQSSFSAESSTLVTFVPSFHYDGSKSNKTKNHRHNQKQEPSMNRRMILSSPIQMSFGPFVAGIPIDIPLWMAKLLHKRRLGQIQIPAWLTTNKLTQILQYEKTSTTLLLSSKNDNNDSMELPFYYYEIAHSLSFLIEKSTLLVLQDIVNVRVDKIRHHFHELSYETLQTTTSSSGGGSNKGMNDDAYASDNDDKDENDDDPLIVEIPGIASVELNKIGPFLKRAFTDFASLSQPPSSMNKATVPSQMSSSDEKENQVHNNKGQGTINNNNKYGDHDDDDEESENFNANNHNNNNTPGRYSVPISRLRRFRA